MGERPFHGDPRGQVLEPIIRKVGRVTLVGVPHDSAFTFDKKPIFAEIIDIVGKADHLLLEGTSVIHELTGSNDLSRHGFESLALWTFSRRGKGNDIYYLEEKKDPIRLAISHGFDLNTAILLHSYDDIMDINNPDLCPPAARSDHLRRLAAFNKRKYPALSANVKILEDVYQSVADNLARFQASNPEKSQRFREFEGGFLLLFDYIRVVRDFEIIGPKMQLLLPSLSGKPVVMLGKLHIETLEAILNGDQTPYVPPWQFFETTIDPEAKGHARLFVDVANGRF